MLGGALCASKLLFLPLKNCIDVYLCDNIDVLYDLIGCGVTMQSLTGKDRGGICNVRHCWIYR